MTDRTSPELTTAELLGPGGEALALALEAADDVPTRRAQFAVPPWLGGREPEVAYLAGNSLGLQPHAARAAIDDVLDSWATLGVAGHGEGAYPWMPYHETMRETSARLVGALPGETVIMNSLTVNLHLLLWTFYRPTQDRNRIVVEADAFPSDRYAVASQTALHDLDPADAVVALEPRPGERHLRTEDVVELLERDGSSVAMVLLGAVNFRTGALLDIPAITDATQRAGAVSAWDLAHAAGNVPLALHDWGVDIAAWCTYKYLNAGPGSTGGCFVHERHGADVERPRPAGWWGNDPATRFQMEPGFQARPGADGWQLSNPSILAMAPVRASLELFDEVGIDVLRARSVRLTGFLERLLDAVAEQSRMEMVTPRQPSRRGAQLTIEVDDAVAITEALRERHGVVADDRPTRLVRLAPAPLYTTYHDIWRAAVALADVLPRR